MSYSKRLSDKAYDSLLKNLRKQRGLVLFLFAVIQFCLLMIFGLFQMSVNGVSYYIGLPICLCASLLTSLGGSMFLLFVFGAYTALKPVKKDVLNPINRALPIKEDTRIAVLMPIYHEDPARVGGGLMAMMEEMAHEEEAQHFDWFILSDSRNVDIIVQEEFLVFFLREKFPQFNIAYRHRINNTFSKVGNISDFYRRWGSHYKYVVMLDADSILPGDSCITLARSMEGNNNTALIQSRFMEINSSTLFGMVSNFRFMFDNYLYTYYYNFFNPGRGFYMGHNAIIRVKAFMECCNLPVAEKTRFFPEGKMISHDYYEGALLLGAGYDTWILPQIISFDEQLHNIINFYARERRWLVGAQTWFRFFMSKSLSYFGKINMFQRAIFYYAATIGIFTFILSFYGLHYTFSHPLKTHMALQYMKHHARIGYMKYAVILGLILLVPSTTQITVYYFTFWKKGNLSKMGGHIKYIISYFIFSFLQGNVMLIAMCLINKFLFDWFSRKELVWGAQDREGTLLPWKVCFQTLYPLSILGIFLVAYTAIEIFPYMTEKSMRLMHLPKSGFFLFMLQVAILFPPVVLACAPVFARLTSQKFPWFKKMKWLHTPYDEENRYPVVKNTYKYTSELRKILPSDLTFEEAMCNPWYAAHHLYSLEPRPQKYQFWADKLKDKTIAECSRLEKLVIFRCPELWKEFVMKEKAQTKRSS